MTNLFPEILSKQDVGDFIFPSSNVWGIPDLNPKLQPLGLELPANRWGAKARKNRVEGQTVHFFCDDYRFTGLWKDPTPIINSGARAMAECNFSTNGEMPKAVVLAYIYMKRWISAYVQRQAGIEIWVDLAINRRWHDIALLGVPKWHYDENGDYQPGWKSYATYTYIEGYEPEEWLFPQWDLAVEHSGEDHPTLWVYGGEEDIQRLCQERGWLWTPAHQQAYLRNVGATKVREEKPPKLPRQRGNKKLERGIVIEDMQKPVTLMDWC